MEQEEASEDDLARAADDHIQTLRDLGHDPQLPDIVKLGESIKSAVEAAKQAGEAPSKLEPLPREPIQIRAILKDLAGLAVLVAGLPIAFYFLRSLRLEWVVVALASWAIARVWGRERDRSWGGWARAYIVACGIALFLYFYAAAGEDQGLFGVIFRPAHFNHALKVGAAALLSIWAGIGAAHFSHDPDWAREKERRKSQAEGVAEINAGGRCFWNGREMTVFEGRLVPMYPIEPNDDQKKT